MVKRLVFEINGVDATEYCENIIVQLSYYDVGGSLKATIHRHWNLELEGSCVLYRQRLRNDPGDPPWAPDLWEHDGDIFYGYVGEVNPIQEKRGSVYTVELVAYQSTRVLAESSIGTIDFGELQLTLGDQPIWTGAMRDFGFINDNGELEEFYVCNSIGYDFGRNIRGIHPCKAIARLLNRTDFRITTDTYSESFNITHLDTPYFLPPHLTFMQGIRAICSSWIPSPPAMCIDTLGGLHIMEGFTSSSETPESLNQDYTFNYSDTNRRRQTDSIGGVEIVSMGREPYSYIDNATKSIINIALEQIPSETFLFDGKPARYPTLGNEYVYVRLTPSYIEPMLITPALNEDIRELPYFIANSLNKNRMNNTELGAMLQVWEIETYIESDNPFVGIPGHLFQDVINPCQGKQLWNLQLGKIWDEPMWGDDDIGVAYPWFIQTLGNYDEINSTKLQIRFNPFEYNPKFDHVHYNNMQYQREYFTEVEEITHNFENDYYQTNASCYFLPPIGAYAQNFLTEKRGDPLNYDYEEGMIAEMYIPNNAQYGIPKTNMWRFNDPNCFPINICTNHKTQWQGDICDTEVSIEEIVCLQKCFTNFGNALFVYETWEETADLFPYIARGAPEDENLVPQFWVKDQTELDPYWEEEIAEEIYNNYSRLANQIEFETVGVKLYAIGEYYRFEGEDGLIIAVNTTIDGGLVTQKITALIGLTSEPIKIIDDIAKQIISFNSEPNYSTEENYESFLASKNLWEMSDGFPILNETTGRVEFIDIPGYPWYSTSYGTYIRKVM